MRAIEVTGTIDEKGQVYLDQPIEGETPSRVRIIVLFSETKEELENDPDDTPIEEIKASLRIALQEAKEGKRIPLSEMWEGIDAEGITFSSN
ncbi:hypothetical protein [Kamptonema sp. UHCC 0994]|uniref:type II toxin-antitoxin system RelN family antitoxin n=1 Tax=Kamptonema sp. UHCC 0994 TaxID=3031329 RepID=UPI0023B9CF5D|nr:hypothetical protein [Kamptonema sp. UHCC 0994]MDF0555696.1 hypothetical protein [Kamptonema sp. UHCC 0994]